MLTHGPPPPLGADILLSFDPVAYRDSTTKAGQGTAVRRRVASLPFSASPFESASRQRASLERGSRRMSETENGFTLGSMVGHRYPARRRQAPFHPDPTAAQMPPGIWQPGRAGRRPAPTLYKKTGAAAATPVFYPNYFRFLISSCSLAMKSATGSAPSSPLSRLRTETVPLSTSFSPTTSMYGTFLTWASRIL